MIAIIDYGLGNLGSIRNMINKISYPCEIISKPSQLNQASKLILPGVGSFDTGMKNLKNLNWIEELNFAVLEKKTPILGICLGMQLMAEKSDEGVEKGLSWLPLEVKHLSKLQNFSGSIPIMGWNYVQTVKNNPLIAENEANKFYFVHSYFFEGNNPYEMISTQNEELNYCAGFQKDNIFGVQFHPEKSHKFGQKILNNFCSL